MKLVPLILLGLFFFFAFWKKLFLKEKKIPIDFDHMRKLSVFSSPPNTLARKVTKW